MLSYVIKDALYLNITNRCANDCLFCIRKTATVRELWLDQEPSADEVVKSVGDPTGYKEIVFCGYGEPLLRPEVVTAVAGRLREYGVPIRIDTNGLAERVLGIDIVESLSGLIDSISISLVAHDAPTYARLTRSQLGEEGFDAVLRFTERCLLHIPRVEMSVVRWESVDIEACRKIAGDLGARFRVREYRTDMQPVRR